MAETSWPFASGAGTAVGEDQWSKMARLWVGNGVVAGYANTLQVYGDSSGRQVKVKTGRATVRGHFYENTSEVTLAIGANASGNPRIDRVALTLDPTANTVALAVVAGTPTGSPSAPTLTQTDVGVYQVTLAKVLVVSGATTIAVGDVTDERTYALSTDAVASRFTADYVPIADFSGSPASAGPITLPAVPAGFTGWGVTASCQMVSSGNAASSFVSVGVVGTSLYLELASGLSSLVAGVHYTAIAY